MASIIRKYKGAVVTPWNREDLPKEEELIQTLRSEGLASYRWANKPGDVYSAHTHSFKKVIFVVEGSIEFGLPQQNERFKLTAGDRLELAAGVLHGARVGSTGVVCREAHC